ncbi:MAG: bacillithiol biosynthesis cysteine-adding enzyme BshC [Bacteroidota bacterium]|nr:bacillithiol biosynthesis cysteine-adding enzyme BshC [Bacteroidota bacterium]
MFAAQFIPYHKTNVFSKIVVDYLAGKEQLQSFYQYPTTLNGIQQAILQKQQQRIDRTLLVHVLRDQYRSTDQGGAVIQNLEALLSPNTFVICTAHQPNLCTGPLYFVYKILHAIKLSSYLNQQLSGYRFVPVYYMGSEDADSAELNHFTVEGKRYEWQTDQRGAVGRMKIDKKLIALLDELELQLGITPNGKEWVQLLREHYHLNVTIQEATFGVVHALFKQYGLIVLIADDARLKKQMLSIFEEDLFLQNPSLIVSDTCKKLDEQYKVQANPRDINLFYLKDNIRERIERKGDDFIVCNTSIQFSEAALRSEIQKHPERFSPNVILRGLYQETILPNIAFVGGGGELAYWLQLKDLFQHYAVPYPVLILRNSFLVVEKKWQEKINKLELTVSDFFETEDALMNKIVQRFATHSISLNGKLEKAEELYEQIKQQAGAVDPTLLQHVTALQTQSINNLKVLEKKMLRAEKRKFTDQQRQIQTIRNYLFPKYGLQERVENIGTFYTKWGRAFIDELYQYSLALGQRFVILTQQ